MISLNRKYAYSRHTTTRRDVSLHVFDLDEGELFDNDGVEGEFEAFEVKAGNEGGVELHSTAHFSGALRGAVFVRDIYV